MNNMLGLGIVLSLRDRASSGLDTIRGKMTALRDVSQEMMKRFDEGAKQMVAGFASIATGAKVLGLLNTTFGVSLSTAADFEQAMARVGAVSGAVGEDFDALSKQARDLGRDTQYSATQAANSQELLARAGFQTNEIISAMPGLLNMAAAEGMDLANAADIASSALRGFGLGADEMNRVADVLAKTSAASNTSISLLGESLKYVARPATALGFSIEQVNAMLGVMANAGIKGSQAGTSLRTAFLRLSKEPKVVAKALSELGVNSRTAQGDLRPLPELMKDLANKMSGMGKADKMKYLANIFGAEAASGMLAIMEAAIDASDKGLSALEQALYGCSGAAKEMADRMNATAQGAMKRLESATEGLRIVIGNHLLPVYTWAIDKMAQFKSWLTQLIEAHPIITKAVIGFTSALIGLSGSALILVGALASVGGMVKMWPLMRKMAVYALTSIRSQARIALSSLSGLSVPVMAMIALAGVLYYAWRKNLWGIRDMVEAVTQGFKLAWSASTDGIAEIDDELAKKLQAAGIFDYAVMMGQVFFRVRQFWNGLVEGFKDGLDFLMGIFDWLKGIFSPVIESGQELLKFLSILKPVTETHAETWKAWGQLIGRIAPAVIGVIAAFKSMRVISGIFGDLGKAIMGTFSLIMAHPVVAAITAVIAAIVVLYNYWDDISKWFVKTWNKIPSFGKAILMLVNPIITLVATMITAGKYVYTHWEEVSAKFAKIWNKIADYGRAAADWVKRKWQAFSDWWDSWTLADVFASIISWVNDAISGARRKLDEFNAWWDSWKLSDIFAPIYDFAVEVITKIKQPFIDFKNWLLGLFANMNPFNWELPSWLGGGKAGDNQVKNANAALSGYQPPSIRANGGIITQPEIALIGEAGREAVIPLENASRGTALWLEAGRELGLIHSNNAESIKQIYSASANVINNSHADGNVTNMSRVISSSNNVMSGIASIAPHAMGGIFSQPHIGLVAEAGREAIIPLERQARGTELWLEAGRELGLISENAPQVSTPPNVNMPEVSLLNSINTGHVSNVMPEIVNALKVQPNVNVKSGMFQQPHIELIAEAGREAIIPLEKQSRVLFEAEHELRQISGSNMTASYGNTPAIGNKANFRPGIRISAGQISDDHSRNGISAFTRNFTGVDSVSHALTENNIQNIADSWNYMLNRRNLSHVRSVMLSEISKRDVMPSNLVTDKQAGSPSPDIVNALKFRPEILNIIPSLIGGTLSQQYLPAVAETNYTVSNTQNMADSKSYMQVRNAVPTVIHALLSGAGRGISENMSVNINKIAPESANNVISSVMKFMKLRDDNMTVNNQRTIRQLTEDGIFSQPSMFFTTTGGYDVVPSVVNSLKFQPYAGNVMRRGSAAMSVAPFTENYYSTNSPVILPQVSSPSPQTREMINRMAERSIVREGFDRMIQHGLTSSIFNSATTDRTKQFSQVRDIISRTAQNSVLREITRSFTDANVSAIPHAMGGIFSTPHIGLVAEAGREAVIPLADKSRGIPLLMAAANELIGENIITNQPYSLPTLIQQTHNQATAQAMAQPAEKQSASNSKVTVNVDVKPADVYIDGERIGRISFRWSERQSIRSGIDS